MIGPGAIVLVMDGDRRPDRPARPAPTGRHPGRPGADRPSGWARRTSERLMSVFADDAVYIETPFSAAPRHRAIRRFWVESPSSGEMPSPPADLRGRSWFSTEFRCVFRRRTGWWTRWAIFCERGREDLGDADVRHRWNGGRTSKPTRHLPALTSRPPTVSRRPHPNEYRAPARQSTRAALSDYFIV
jgi:hypothetical protein